MICRLVPLLLVLLGDCAADPQLQRLEAELEQLLLPPVLNVERYPMCVQSWATCDHGSPKACGQASANTEGKAYRELTENNHTVHCEFNCVKLLDAEKYSAAFQAAAADCLAGEGKYCCVAVDILDKGPPPIEVEEQPEQSRANPTEEEAQQEEQQENKVWWHGWRLKNWVQCDGVTCPEGSFQGEVYGRDSFTDGAVITTSRVLPQDDHSQQGWIKTRSGSIYLLWHLDKYKECSSWTCLSRKGTYKGIITGRPKFPDGSSLRTSRIKERSEEGWIKTKSGSIYALGEPVD